METHLTIKDQDSRHNPYVVINSLLPEGLVITPKTRQYYTKKMNRLLAAIPYLATDNEESKNKKATQISGLSLLVAGKIEISKKFITDLVAVANLKNH